MEPDGHVSVDGIFELLSHNRRRLALQYFRQFHNPIDLEDLARGIARWEQPSATVPAEVEVQQVRTALHETHLPKLEEAGFVEYRREDRTVVTDEETVTAAMENAVNVIQFLYDAPERPEAG
jgi:hypothetical protein